MMAKFGFNFRELEHNLEHGIAARYVRRDRKTILSHVHTYIEEIIAASRVHMNACTFLTVITLRLPTLLT